MSELFDKLRIELLDSPKVLEIGAMFGDSLMAAPGPIRVAIEPHRPYIDFPDSRKYRDHITFINGTAQDVIPLFLPNEFDAILMIDFPEHLEKVDAIEVVERCKFIARKKIIWFSPCGPHPQTKDLHNLGGDYWQTHRSSWELEEVQALGFQARKWDRFHKIDHPKNPHAIYGIWYKQ